MLLTLSGKTFIKSRTVIFRYSTWRTLPHSKVSQYYVKHEKFKVNDVIFPSGCEACAINLGNKNMKIGIFTGVTYGGTKVTWKIYFILRAHAVGNTCARISYCVRTQ